MTLRLENLYYRYPKAEQATIDDLCLTVESGEKLVITGPTGCGKSTLLRLIVGGLQRHGQGQVKGAVLWEGRAVTQLQPSERAQYIARVAQQPKDQILGQRVDEELAFGMSAIGLSSQAQQAAIPTLLEAVQLRVAADRNPAELSGGQLQRLMIAAALATRAQIICLDEPLAHLDHTGAEKLLQILSDLSQQGIIVIMVEHRLSLCAEWADSIFSLEGGALRRMPVEDALASQDREMIVSHPPRIQKKLLWTAENMTWAYPRGKAIFEGQKLSLYKGEWLALEGENGAGKSSLLRFLEENPQGVRLLVLPQDPSLCLFSETVYDELAYGPMSWGFSEPDAWVKKVALELDLLSLLDRAPLSLSSGQQLRVALAAILACKPEIICLDEPTVGQDHGHVVSILKAIVELAPDAAVVISTHDDRLLGGAMDRHIRIQAGQFESYHPSKRAK